MRKSAFYETRNGFKATLSLNDLDDNLWIDIMLPKFLNQDDIVYKDSNVEIINSTHLGAFFNIASAAATIRINGRSKNSRYCIKCREEGINSELFYDYLNKAFARLAREFDERSATTLIKFDRYYNVLTATVLFRNGLKCAEPAKLGGFSISTGSIKIPCGEPSYDFPEQSVLILSNEEEAIEVEEKLNLF